LGEEKEKKKVKEKEKEKGAWRAPADLHPLAVTVFTGGESVKVYQPTFARKTSNPPRHASSAVSNILSHGNCLPLIVCIIFTPCLPFEGIKEIK